MGKTRLTPVNPKWGSGHVARANPVRGGKNGDQINVPQGKTIVFIVSPWGIFMPKRKHLLLHRSSVSYVRSNTLVRLFRTGVPSPVMPH